MRNIITITEYRLDLRDWVTFLETRDIYLNAAISLPLYCSDRLPTTRDIVHSGRDRHAPRGKKGASVLEKIVLKHKKERKGVAGVVN